MKEYRCECGKSVAVSSMGVAPCEYCEECGTTLGMVVSQRHDPEPHDWEIRYDERTGKRYRWCPRCNRTSAIEEREMKAGRFEHVGNLSSAQGTAIEGIGNMALALEGAIREGVPDGREKAVAMTNLEQAIMWANKGITHASGVGVSIGEAPR